MPGTMKVIDHESVLLFLQAFDENEHSREILFPIIFELFPTGKELTSRDVVTRMLEAFNRYLDGRFGGMTKKRMRIVLDQFFGRYVAACMNPTVEFLHEVEEIYVSDFRERFFAG